MPPHRLLLPHLPSTLPIYITSYQKVTNSPHLLSQLLAQNPTYNYTFIDARTILSTTHLLAACFRALTDHLHNRLKSNNVHSEIVFCLSANNNVGEAFRRFGVREVSESVVVIKVGDGHGGEEGEVKEGLRGIVEGTEVDWEGMEEWLGSVCDVDVVRANYKLGKGSHGGGGGASGKKKGEVVVNGNGEDAQVKKERERKELERVVLGLMALRGAT